jgi:hypothetical protein
MATRIYHPSSGAAAVSPAPSINWDNIAGMVRFAAVTSKIGTGVGNQSAGTNGGAGADEDHLIVQYVSDTIGAITIPVGTAIKAQLRIQETAVASNQFLTGAMWICSNDGSVRRGTLLTITRDNVEANAASLQNRSFTAVTGEEVVALNGDRIVIEWGSGGVPASGGSHASTIQLRDNGTDLPENDTQTTAGDPWTEIDVNFVFGVPPDPAAEPAFPRRRYYQRVAA